MEERLYQVLYGPHVTEKAVSSNESNTHVFKVATTATKGEIKSAVETLFEVKVAAVRSVNVKGKQKNFGKRKGFKKDWKKAYVRLAEGSTLNVEAEG
ncbi:MAG: 50S ribosomal protein L23 [Thiotrichales bacterium]|nr:MAG: 50S ribosomal protein L23 [Thiotrichales bacterium]